MAAGTCTSAIWPFRAPRELSSSNRVPLPHCLRLLSPRHELRLLSLRDPLPALRCECRLLIRSVSSSPASRQTFALLAAWHIDIELPALDLGSSIGYHVFARIMSGMLDLDSRANGQNIGIGRDNVTMGPFARSCNPGNGVGGRDIVPSSPRGGPPQESTAVRAGRLRPVSS